MKREEWNESLNHIDADIIENYVEQKEEYIAKNKRKRMWLKIGAMAACFCLFLGAVINPNLFRSDDDVMIYDSVACEKLYRFEADDIAAIFNSDVKDSVSTNAYTTLWTPDSKYLYIDPLPESEYLDIYQLWGSEKEGDKKEFAEFVDSFLPKLSKSINYSVPSYEIDDEFRISTDLNVFQRKYFIGGSQGSYENNFNFSSFVPNVIKLDGETIQIDQHLSDEEIIDSLSSIKNKLFGIFNVSFSDARVLRKYNESLEYGVAKVYIYFFNEDAHALNSIQNIPVSDYICLCFDNIKNFADDNVSSTILDDASIRYFKKRLKTSSEFKITSKQKKISLEEAEELLYKGYVFGGHSCGLCMAAQNKISFEDYDYVDFEYVFGDNGCGIPFYAFYKKITPDWVENENEKYAKTYVPAIEVDLYEEYFEAQEQFHKS